MSKSILDLQFLPIINMRILDCAAAKKLTASSNFMITKAGIQTLTLPGLLGITALSQLIKVRSKDSRTLAGSQIRGNWYLIPSEQVTP